MFCFCYFSKKKSTVIVAHNGPFFVQFDSKKTILRGFTDFFSELLSCNTSY